MSQRDECGVCRDECPHGRNIHGGNQFCIFCLRTHGDHLGVELKVCEREKLVILAENEAIRAEKSELRGVIIRLVESHEPGDELGAGIHQAALDIIKKTDWKRW